MMLFPGVELLWVRFVDVIEQQRHFSESLSGHAEFALKALLERVVQLLVHL